MKAVATANRSPAIIAAYSVGGPGRSTPLTGNVPLVSGTKASPSPVSAHLGLIPSMLPRRAIRFRVGGCTARRTRLTRVWLTPRASAKRFWLPWYLRSQISLIRSLAASCQAARCGFLLFAMSALPFEIWTPWTLCYKNEIDRKMKRYRFSTVCDRKASERAMTKLTIKQAADRTGLSASLLYQICAERRLPHFRLGREGKRGKILIEETDLDAFIAASRVEAGQVGTPAPLKLITRK
ncbi:MAG: hypothetical protein C0467_19995 [Planctomycetaceae bacterium]|nr:hypothetical protein [Planctomycetaceae bacterium]